MSIEVKDLSFIYSPKTPFEKKALDEVSLKIEEGEFVGIIGHTGSGKSTFIQHLNGLIKLQSGSVSVGEIDLSQKRPKPDLRKLRGMVGMVFQFPEYQLFAETVAQDVAFGPKNLGVKKEEIEGRVKEAIELVGLDYESIKDRSPFDLSGGQKRRVAIAGIIAMRPEILVLDEPTAGLDPSGKEQILELIMHLKSNCSPTIIVISHDIDEISRFATRIVVFNKAKIAFDEPMNQLFLHEKELVEMGLEIPKTVKIKNLLKDRGIILEGDIITPDDLLFAIAEKYNAKHKENPLNLSVLCVREKYYKLDKMAKLNPDYYCKMASGKEDSDALKNEVDASKDESKKTKKTAEKAIEGDEKPDKAQTKTYKKAIKIKEKEAKKAKKMKEKESKKEENQGKEIAKTVKAKEEKKGKGGENA